jgi:HJR/Mrr/RecB family endonuclease
MMKLGRLKQRVIFSFKSPDFSIYVYFINLVLAEMSRCILFLLLMTSLMFKHPIQTFNLLSAALIPMQTP